MLASFSAFDWKNAIKTGLAGSISLFLSLTTDHFFHRPDLFISGLWTTVSAIVVQQAHLGLTYRSAWNRFLGVLVGSFLGGCFTFLLPPNALTLGISIFFNVLICSFLGLKDSIRISCLSVAVVIISWGMHPETSPWIFSFFRFLDSCLGTAVALLIAHALFPLKASEQLSAQIGETLLHLQKLFQLATRLGPLDDLLYFQTIVEKTNQSLWKNHQIIEETKLELLAQMTEGLKWSHFLNHLDLIFEQIQILKKVPKEHLLDILDDNMEKRLFELIKIIDNSFQELNAYLAQAPFKNKELLDESLTNLKAEMTRFRKTKATRQFELNDVEGYFVFFYTIRTIAEELLKMHKHIGELKKMP